MMTIKKEKLKTIEENRKIVKNFLNSNVQNFKILKHSILTFSHYNKHLEIKSFNNSNGYYRFPQPKKKSKIKIVYMPKEDDITIPKGKVKIGDIAHLPPQDIIDFLILNMGFSQEQLNLYCEKVTE